MWVNGRYLNDEYRFLDSNDVHFLRWFIRSKEPCGKYFSPETGQEFNHEYPANMLDKLLAKQMPLMPDKTEYSYNCPNCHGKLVDAFNDVYRHRIHFCSGCGQRLVWGENDDGKYGF